MTLDSIWDVKAGSPGRRSQETQLWKVHYAAALCHLLKLADIGYYIADALNVSLMRVVRSKLLSYGPRGAAELDEKTLVLSP